VKKELQGCIGIGVGDRVYMLENLLGIISPRYLFYGRAGNIKVAEAFKLTSDMKKAEIG
jgi:acetyl-CoA carboxylase alpha subunit